MIDPALISAEPPARLRKADPPSVLGSMRALARSRRQVWALARRDFTARYKQTALGIGWAVLLPLLTVLVFGVFVQRFARADTHGAPYILWSFLGLIGWTFFANAATTGGMSLLTNQSLLNKVYSARQIYPVAGVVLAALDAVISLFVLGVLFALTGTAPKATIYWMPVVVAVELVFVVAAILLLSILIVYVRDLRNVIPFILQLGLFATPVVYGLDKIAPDYRLLYCTLNPLAPVIESYRRVLLYGEGPSPYLVAGAATSVVLLVVASWVFARFERGIVDII